MAKITKRIKKKYEEQRKSSGIDKENVVVTETDNEEVRQSEDAKDVLSKSFVKLNSTLKQSTGGYANQRMSPISVAPSIATTSQSIPTQEQPEPQKSADTKPSEKIETKNPEVVPEKKTSRLGTFVKNVKNIAKEQIGSSDPAQIFGVFKDATKQFKDMFKTQDELFAEQVIEEAKYKKKEAEAKAKEDKLREDILKKAGLWIEKESKKSKEGVEKEEINIGGQVAEDISKIRSMMESQQQESVHSLEDAAEAKLQQAEVVKTLKDIEKDLKDKPQVVKEMKEGNGDNKSILSTLSDFKALGDILSKVVPSVGSLGSVVSALGAAILPVSAILGTVAAGLWGFNKWLDSRAAQNEGTEEWKKVATPEQMKAWEAKISPIKAAEEEQKKNKPEIERQRTLHKWDAVNANFEKIGSDTRIVDGKTVTGKDKWIKNEDGTYSLRQLEVAPVPVAESVSQANQVPENVPNQVPEMQKSPESMSAKLTEGMTEEYNRTKDEIAAKRTNASSDGQTININAVPQINQSQKEKIALFDTRRNNDDTFKRLQDRLFLGAHI